MTIVHVINRLGRGGAEHQLTELVRRSPLTHRVHELQAGSSSRARQLRDLHRLLRRPEVGLVVAWLDRPQQAVALTAPRNLPSIAAVRGLPRTPGGLRSTLLRHALLRYDHVVFNSPASATVMAAFMTPRRLRHTSVIVNGIDESDRTPPPGDVGTPRIGFIGRDDRAKGLDVLLAALAQFPRGEIEACLIGAGVPDAVAQTPGLAITVEALGATGHPWAAAGPLTALVVPSRSEGSPNVVIEAFAAEVPVVGTTAGGTADLLGAGRGLAVPPEDPAAIVAAVRAVIAHPDQSRERSRAALRYVREQHAWEPVVAAWDRLFQSIRDGPPA